MDTEQGGTFDAAPVIHETQVKELVSGKKVLVYTYADADLSDAIHLLRSHGITAMPVRAPGRIPPLSGVAESLQQRAESIAHPSLPPPLVPAEAAKGGSSGRGGEAAAVGSGGGGGDGHGVAGILKVTQETNKPLLVAPSSVRFTGMISLVDIALFLSKRFTASDQQQQQQQQQKPAESFKVKDAMGATEETRHLLVLDPHATLSQAMELLGSRGFHRALVPNLCPFEHGGGTLPLATKMKGEVGGERVGEEYRVLSQSDVISFLLQHEGRLGLSLAQKVEDLGLVWPSVVSVAPTTPVLHAFSLLRTYGVTALAVAEGKEVGRGQLGKANLVGTLSASDLKFCDEKQLEQLEGLTVMKFLDKLRDEGKSMKAITCTRSTSLRSVMTAIRTYHVHRVWAVEEVGGKQVLEGVISLSDIIRTMRVMPVTNPPNEDMLDAQGNLKAEETKATAEIAAPARDFIDAISSLDQTNIDSWMWMDWWPLEAPGISGV